ncbi:MAG: signal recognition particle protein, partial [Clostridia bacterium]
EKPDGLEPFYPERMASRILGMGDMMSLIEKAQASFDENSAARLETKARNASFTLEDFLDQMQQIKKMGPLQNILGMLPGVGSKLKDVEIDENALKKPEAVIRSMTPAERKNPDLLNASRRRRIAAGSGTTVQDVNQVVKQYDYMRQMMKQAMGGRAGKRRMRMPGV